MKRLSIICIITMLITAACNNNSETPAKTSNDTIADKPLLTTPADSLAKGDTSRSR